MWAHVDFGRTPDDCWRWHGARNERGYPRIRYGGKVVYAHRLSFELAYGPLEPGVDVHHTCGDRRCIRPDHLEAIRHDRHSPHHAALRQRARELERQAA